MDYATRNYIEELAQAVITAYNIPTPINDIEKVVQDMGGQIEVKRDFDDLCDGTIRKDRDGFHIAVSPFQNDRRKAFTIAHELGHFFMICIFGFKLQRNFSHEEIPPYQDPEWQAKCFAGEFMIPAGLVQNMTPHEIAKSCGVSLDAAKVQYKHIND